MDFNTEWVSFLCSRALIAQMRIAVNQSPVGLHQWIRNAIKEKIERESQDRMAQQIQMEGSPKGDRSGMCFELEVSDGDPVDSD